MLIAPRPGADRTNLSQTLRHLLNQAINVRSASDQFDAYVQWAAEGVRTLRNQVSSASLDELVLTKRYWALQSMGALPPYVTRALLQVELAERVDALEATCRSYEEQIASWSRPGIFVVADSSFYIHHIEKVEDLDLRPILEIREEPVHLIFPIAVVDELDRLKNTGTKLARWRARHTLQVLDAVLPLPPSPGRLREGDSSPLKSGSIPRGEITVEIVLDPPGHQRLPIMDDEIIDRTLAVQGLAGRRVRFLTYDTGQSTRARAAGLHTIKIPQLPEEQEPNP